MAHILYDGKIGSHQENLFGDPKVQAHLWDILQELKEGKATLTKLANGTIYINATENLDNIWIAIHPKGQIEFGSPEV